VACSDSRGVEVVDLGHPQLDPAALLKLKQTQSTHYDKVVGTLAQLQTGLPTDIAGVQPVEVRFGVKDVCNSVVRTSFPVLRYVSSYGRLESNFVS
jgi:hypothetical protein